MDEFAAPSLLTHRFEALKTKKIVFLHIVSQFIVFRWGFCCLLYLIFMIRLLFFRTATLIFFCLYSFLVFRVIRYAIDAGFASQFEGKSVRFNVGEPDKARSAFVVNEVDLWAELTLILFVAFFLGMTRLSVLKITFFRIIIVIIATAAYHLLPAVRRHRQYLPGSSLPSVFQPALVMARENFGLNLSLSALFKRNSDTLAQ
eukprot:gnl/Dysnectes_brevis/2827_a3452_1353.p1 GENE.gnl/Dysnectes_brevis/2827_a3452_1353~~gnl/Dysnectes_brevis/2827_a3452_1353.p1  ORF type:complete len:202 (+),score=21.58 gnl/Dysnectes_brevis/2827_a3452_1353:453-1058(+)